MSFYLCPKCHGQSAALAQLCASCQQELFDADSLTASIMSGPKPQDKDYLREAAKAVEAKLPDNHGFILLVAPFGAGANNRLTYISSMQRADAINVLKEWLISASGKEEWMQHIK